MYTISEYSMQTVDSYRKKEDLVSTLRSKGFDDSPDRKPTHLTIEDAVKADDLHEFDPRDVLSAAYDFGFLISVCCKDANYKANGIWLHKDQIDPRVADELETARINKQSPKIILTHGYCPVCFDKAIQEINAGSY